MKSKHVHVVKRTGCLIVTFRDNNDTFIILGGSGSWTLKTPCFRSTKVVITPNADRKVVIAPNANYTDRQKVDAARRGFGIEQDSIETIENQVNGRFARSARLKRHQWGALDTIDLATATRVAFGISFPFEVASNTSLPVALKGLATE